MASAYHHHLSAASLRLLAETTGFGCSQDLPGTLAAFERHPHDLKQALCSPQAAQLLELAALAHDEPREHQLLQLAVAVHQTAEDICQAGWSATDASVIDLDLLGFSGQSSHQRFVVELLSSYLPAPGFDPLSVIAKPTTTVAGLARLYALIDLCSSVSPSERPGALRLLGDEALFCAGLFPAAPHGTKVDLALLNTLRSVLPKAVVVLLDELEPQLRTLLDVHLMFGPIWYRMAAQRLPSGDVRDTIGDIASNFVTARRFIVQVAQGPLARLKDELYPHLD